MKLKLTTLCMALLLVCGQVFAATSGKCGDNVRWTLDNNGTLTISGTGPMKDYNNNNDLSPWAKSEVVKKVIIKEGVTTVGNFAFYLSSAVSSVTFPSSLISINNYAFYNNFRLKEIELPNGFSKIGKSGLYACGLTSITLPNTLDEIGENAFALCPVTSIYVPAGVKKIGDWPFSNSHLQSVTVDSNNPNYVSVDGVLYTKDMKKLILYPAAKEGSTYTVPEGVEKIGTYAFIYSKYLRSVTIASTVKSVGYDMFCEVEGLQTIRYPKGLDLKTEATKKARAIAYGAEKTPSATISPKAPTQPPLLALVDESLTFKDGNGNNRIDAEEKCTVKFRVANNGKGAATNCEARVKISGATNGITVKTVKLPTIAAGNNYEVSVPVTSNINTINGQVSLAIEIYEPNGFGVEPFAMNVSTKAYDPPYLQIVDYQVSSVSGKIRKMEPFIVTCNLQNTKYGNAENVTVHVNIPANIFLVEGEETVTIPQVKSGEVVNLKFGFLANTNYNTGSVPITFEVKEKHGKFAENKQLNIALNQTTSSTINIAAKDEPQQERKEIQLAMMTSDVDRNIPVTKAKNPNTFVLIIANEHYQQVASVPFALNDGNIFREYCIKTLGIGEKHIHYVADATGNQIKAHINWLANITETWDDAQVIVYYAGHGIPDEASKSAYLLPVDGSGTDVTTGYKLDDLYATLGSMPASQITVFMDACFSGSKREQGMLASARGVALKAKSGVPQGNMVVFSAAQGDETAYPNKEQQHGLFTYYLLKKLQETQGDIALKDLGDYVTKQVSQESLLLNNKKQTPCVTPSASVGTDWQNWKLK